MVDRTSGAIAVANCIIDRMKMRSLIALSFGIVTVGASVPAFAQSTNSDRSTPKIKLESIDRRPTTEPKTKTCNIQCITTPCPCTDKINDYPIGNKPQNRIDKFDRQK
jgi:hypothetical protein